jgi:hypothetical protein
MPVSSLASPRAILAFLGCVGACGAGLAAQGQTQPSPAGPSNTAPANTAPLTTAVTTTAPTTPALSPSADLERRLATLEAQLRDRHELFKELNQFFWLVTAMGTLGSILAFLALFRDSFAKRERALAKHDVQFTTAAAQYSDRAALAQIQNLENVSGLIRFVHDAFEIQGKQKEALENLRTQQEANFAAQIDKLTKALNAETQRETERTRDANAKYLQVVGMMETFERTQALEWPTLPPHLLRLADHARVALQNIPRDLLDVIVAGRTNEHASMLQRLGVAAYYDFYQIGIALELLGEAERLFEVTPDLAFSKARAYTQHFLAIIEKNWCLKGDSIGASLDRSAGRLREAVAILGKDEDHFLTPVTLAEVLSYRGDNAWEEADEHLRAVCTRAAVKGLPKLDANQVSLYVRALLLQGNIEFRRSAARTTAAPPLAARTKYEEASAVRREGSNSKANPFSLLSIARTMEPPDTPVSVEAGDNRDAWRRGLDALNRSEAIRKHEMTQRVTAIAWGILAASRLGDRAEELRYRDEFAASGADKNIAGRFPLCFSPFGMTIVPYEELKKDLQA